MKKSLRLSLLSFLMVGADFTESGAWGNQASQWSRGMVLAQTLGVELEQQADQLNQAGIALYQQGEVQAALAQFQKAAEIYKRLGDRSGEATTLNNIGWIFSETQPELAIIFLKQSVNTTESLRDEIRGLPTDLQQTYTQTVEFSYRKLADLLLQADRVLEAQQVLDLLKVQELEDYLSTVRGNAETRKGVIVLRSEQEILAQFDARQTSAIELGNELAQLRQIPEAQRTPAQQQRLVQLDTLQNTLNQDFNEFLRSPSVQAALDQLSRTALRQAVDLADLNAQRQQLQDLNAVLLYPFILDDRLELIITTPQSAPLRRTVPVAKTDLNRTIVTFLHDQEQWLIQRFRVNNITAKSLSSLSRQSALNLNILAGAFVKGAYQFRVGTEQFNFNGLPFAGQEVAQLVAAFPGTTHFVDRDFSLAAVQPRMGDHSILHLATHAAFVPGQPEDSFVLFGNGDRATLRDIANWSLFNVDLVVLSACETGLGGNFGNGEEILGLGYQFQQQGAKATIASLWKVDDGGTQALMEVFYNLLQPGNVSKVEALRQAQLALIHSQQPTSGGRRGAAPDWEELALPPGVQKSLNHPYYWASFVLIGNGL
ncbi:CHAT domain-containing protein [Synechococcales cyanobacterium C]|uniref:CHAT domain-containing protein n=1 Tax=Petrachloros mirabilis ULC683 TaxID=2781853 RepID=A0A8K2A0Y8_9CYAN|nr:CHAT domain-containing protein [Petrachloros mirabilis]NCJ07586.1 CHAT domain-containing protein [Petrachloros mirabilis ULC683]